MRVLVCGSRNYRDQRLVWAVLEEIGPEVVVHGACPTGADHFADLWCLTENVAAERHPAEWDRYGRRAGPIRNQEMLEPEPDLVVAFGRGRGTDHMVSLAERAGIRVKRFA